MGLRKYCWLRMFAAFSSERQPPLERALSCHNIPYCMSRALGHLQWWMCYWFVPQGPTLPAQHVIEVCQRVVLEQMSTFANSVKRTCAAVCPLYGDVPMGAPGPPGQSGPPGPQVSIYSLGFNCFNVNQPVLTSSFWKKSLLRVSRHLLQTFSQDTLVERRNFSIHCSLLSPWLSKTQTHCKVLDWTKRAEVFGRKAWNENITTFHVSMRTNKESHTRHPVCAGWVLESIKAVLGLQILFHIIMQCRTNSCSTTSLITKTLWVWLMLFKPLLHKKKFHYIRLWPESLMLWCLKPNHEQWCTITVQCFFPTPCWMITPKESVQAFSFLF